jgi:PBP1b-binding outer membrane lipoprotein LpoB
MRKIVSALCVSALLLVGCQSEADVASRNVSTAADQFEIDRRIVFFNGITDSYLLQIEGRCSLGNNDTQYQRTVTCKTGDNEYKKHTVGLSDNVSYFSEQLEPAEVDVYRYRVIFRPTTIVPDVDTQTP